MKWYPWLNTPYSEILGCYQQGRGHHSLLLHSQSGNGEDSLCYAISRWMMCKQPDGIKSCRVCHGCRLMIAGNHPDFYHPDSMIGYQSLAIDKIRSIIENLYSRSCYGGVKVVWLSSIDRLTIQAANALLKTIEDPPDNTYFLLGCQIVSCLLPTLRSRCLYWIIPTPNKLLAFRWLQKLGFHDSLSIYTALSICANAPLAAKALLEPSRWHEREYFCKLIMEAHISRDFLMLLPVLNRDKDDGPLQWLLSLIADALRLLHGSGKDCITNLDKKDLVELIAKHWSVKILHNQWQQWVKCLCQWRQINGVSRELLLTYYLINWEIAMDGCLISL